LFSDSANAKALAMTAARECAKEAIIGSIQIAIYTPLRRHVTYLISSMTRSSRGQFPLSFVFVFQFRMEDYIALCDQSITASTRESYEFKMRRILAFLNERGSELTIHTFASFLCHLRDEGHHAFSTAEGYRFAILFFQTTRHWFCSDGVAWASSPEAKRLCLGFSYSKKPIIWRVNLSHTQFEELLHLTNELGKALD
jgi:hypothetical protein